MTEVHVRRKHIVTGLCVLLVLWLGFGLVPFFVAPSWERAASVGEAFGAVNALFSALALGGAILAIVLQGQELALQRDELAATRAEVTETRLTHQEHLAHLEKSEAQRRSLEIDREFRAEVPRQVVQALDWWRDNAERFFLQKSTVSLELGQAQARCKLDVDVFFRFVHRVDALAPRNLLDRQLCQALFGREVTRLCSDLEGRNMDFMQCHWVNWGSEIRPELARVRQFLSET